MSLWILVLVVLAPVPDLRIATGVGQAFRTQAECLREADTKNAARRFNVPGAMAVCIKAETGRAAAVPK